MISLKKLKQKKIEVQYLLESFRKEAKGVAAVEFAFLAPIMLLMYIGTLEISSAVSANRKLSRSAYTVGDLVSQHISKNNCIPAGDIADIIKITDDILYPYPHAMKISVTGIKITNDTNKVAWSKGYNGGQTFTKNQKYTSVPQALNETDGYLIATKIRMNYQPYIGFATFSEEDSIGFDEAAIPMEKELFAKPRSGKDLELC